MITFYISILFSDYRSDIFNPAYNIENATKNIIKIPGLLSSDLQLIQLVSILIFWCLSNTYSYKPTSIFHLKTQHWKIELYMLHYDYHDSVAWRENYLIKTLNDNIFLSEGSQDNISLAENINIIHFCCSNF